MYESGSFSFSTDFFMVNVSDRLTTSRNFELSPEDIARPVASGVIREGGVLKRFRFFIDDVCDYTRVGCSRWLGRPLRDR